MKSKNCKFIFFYNLRNKLFRDIYLIGANLRISKNISKLLNELNLDRKIRWLISPIYPYYPAKLISKN
jgi:hypothetical protein